MDADPPKETFFGWYTTAPNPRSPDTGYDAGQRGWRLHAVVLKGDEKTKDLRLLSSLCGIWPRHGWGLDLFIDDECSRCQAAMSKRELAGETFVDLPARRAAESEARRAAEERAEDEAYRAGKSWPFAGHEPECAE